jgi:hypothetical protein
MFLVNYIEVSFTWPHLMMMIMSMGWDHVSELRPPASLLFILRWNDIDRGKLLICPPKFRPVLPVETPSSKAGRTGEGNYEFSLRSISFLFRRFLYHAVKSYDMGSPALPSLRRKACCGFYRLALSTTVKENACSVNYNEICFTWLYLV